ncbi:MAG: hypothetical protein ABIO92_02080 [Chloroflexia bacterium]
MQHNAADLAHRAQILLLSASVVGRFQPLPRLVVVAAELFVAGFTPSSRAACLRCLVSPAGDRHGATPAFPP